MKWLSKSAFYIFVLAIPLHSSLYAGSPPAEDDGGTAQQESPAQPLPFPEFSTQGVNAMKLRGGNYWMGYFIYRIDLEHSLMSALWNKFDCTMQAFEAEVKLSDEDVKAIRSAVEALQYEVIAKDYECNMMADGDESSLTLIHSGQGEAIPAFYPMKSWASRCVGKPLSDLSYQTVEDVIFTILPQPSESSPAHGFGSTEVCRYKR
ncbi:MAG: hypothetical protein H7318_02545 [Oligoflexus sp.]|nr:hypothetical protein [Oligoflexus sp.]